jgi:hypothetical protein
MEVAGGGSGFAYISYFAPESGSGYADYLRAFSITRGFLAGPLQVSPEFGDTSVWPGDTFGLSTVSPSDVVVSWGSATASTKDKSDIFAASVAFQAP